MADESFEVWARRREMARQRKKGRLRLSALDSGPERGSHVNPEAPRVISRWDGYGWEPVAVARDWAAAAQVQRPLGDADERAGRTDSTRASGSRASKTPGRSSLTTAERKRGRVRELLDEASWR
ncbi:DUF6087 family protein [Actinomycetota bacterium Odt1-20B]